MSWRGDNTGIASLATSYKRARIYTMDTKNKHTLRLAFILAFMVVMLVVVSIDQFRMNDTEDQQAAVLRVYAD